MAPVEDSITEEGREWRFCGLWSKNRVEWDITFFGQSLIRSTCVGIYDSMGPDAVDYVIKMTKMPTIFASAEYLDKILAMKKDGLAKEVANVVLFDQDDQY